MSQDATSEPPARQLAEFIAAVEYDRLPLDIRELAKMLTASTLASSAAGIDLQSVASVRDGTRGMGIDGPITVWFRGATTEAATAARLNAMSSDAAASDDSDLRFGTHAGTPAVAAALAIAEDQNASGAEIVTAVAIGCETAARFGTAVGEALLQKRFHLSVIAAFAAAASAAVVLRSTADEIHVALSLAASTAAGLAFASGSDLRPYQAGMAAQCGTAAALAAKQGYRVEDALSPPGGFFEAFGPSRYTDLYLGGRWTFAETVTFKLWGGAFLFAAVAEAAADAARRAGVATDEIAELIISGPAFVAADVKVPRNRVEALGSLAYAAAAAAASHGLGWTHLSEHAIRDPEVERLLQRVVVDRNQVSDYSWRFGASVTAVTASGARVVSRVDTPLGTVKRGVSWADIDAKARALLPLGGMASKTIEALLLSLHQLDTSPSSRALTTVLREAPG